MENNNKLIATIIAILLIISVAGVSYAYFTAQLQGTEEETTITVTGGTMRLFFNGGNNITVSNIIPGSNAVATKVFTVTGNNTTDLQMQYTISIVVDANTFSTNALSYTLESANTSSSGTPVPSITSNNGIPSGTGTYPLGIGSHIEGTGKIHTYTLNIYFLDTGGDQNIDQGKQFQAHIGIEGGETITPTGELLVDSILNQGEGALTIEAKGNPIFTKIAVSEDTGLYASDDEYGISYYFRGEKDLLNNNIIFAGFQWKIVRVNGNRSIRIIYNGICPDNNCIINNLHVDTEEGATAILKSGTDYTHAWNAAPNNDNKYLGYMYGGAKGVASTCRDGEGCATANETNSNAKEQLELWYLNNIANQEEIITSKIVDNLFCNNRQLQSEVGGASTGTGFGKSDTYYSPHYRLYVNKKPTLKCNQQNDRFTAKDLAIGNGALEYPVGLISADEAIMAGLTNSTNSTNYLYTSQNYWTSSPFYFNLGWERVGLVHSTGGVTSAYPYSANGLRPTLNLSAETIISGQGSTENPYKVL